MEFRYWVAWCSGYTSEMVDIQHVYFVYNSIDLFLKDGRDTYSTLLEKRWNVILILIVSVFFTFSSLFLFEIVFQDQSYLQIEKNIFLWKSAGNLSQIDNSTKRFYCIPCEKRLENNFLEQARNLASLLNSTIFFENYPVELRVLLIHRLQSLTFVFLAGEYFSTMK